MKRILFGMALLPAALAGIAGMEAAPQVQQLEEQVREGDSVAMYRLSYLLETGRGGVVPDSVRADSLLRASAEKGYAPACNLLGYRYFDLAPDTMLMWIQRAATAPEPDPKAFNNLGWLLSTGSGGVKRDMKKALYWYERGAEAGVPAAMTSLGELLLDNPEVPKDSVLAASLLRGAAAKGFRPAAERLWLLVAPEAEQLSAEEAREVGLEYFNDRIFPISSPLFMQAAKADDPYALALLAQSYAQGWGVPYDYDHAMHLFWHAALQGDPSAAYIVGETLQQFPDAFADETTQDEQQRTAADWLAQAVEAGITNAHEAIVRLTPKK